MVMSLLQTKLHAPTPPNRNGRVRFVSRLRLLQKLNTGFGKLGVTSRTQALASARAR